MGERKRERKAVSNNKETTKGGRRTGKGNAKKEKTPIGVLSFRPEEDLGKRISRVIPERYDSTSQFLAEAVEEKLRRIETAEAFSVAKGAWSDADHPELANEEDVIKWVRSARGHSE